MNRHNMLSSRQNDTIKFVCKLRDRTKRNRYRMFLIEGCRELGRAIRCEISIDTVFFCRDFIKSGEQEDVLSASEDAGISICEVSRAVFEKISNRDNCDGLIGLANFWDTSVELAKGKNLSFVLVAEGIEKPGNLGALIRSAESAGVDFLILCDPVTDIFNPNVVRASQGAVFSTNIIVTDNKSAYDLLKRNNVNLFATTPGVDDIYFNENFTQNCAILVGAENSGLSDFWLKKDDIKKISLPQSGVCDSLNVNDAAVVVLYEVLRQRILSQKR